MEKRGKMLIAAMILGLIGGISYFIGGCGLAVSPGNVIPWHTQWWAISMIPIGLVGTMGGALVLWKPNLLGPIWRMLQILIKEAIMKAIKGSILSFRNLVITLLPSMLLTQPVLAEIDIQTPSVQETS